MVADATPTVAELDGPGDWLQGVRRLPSPNADERPAAVGIDLLVVHGISLPPGRFGGGYIDALFTNTLEPALHPYFADIAGLRVSAHLLVDRDGTLTQYVPFTRRAWHAGRSNWGGRARCNDFSIGVELEGTDDSPYTDAQYTRLGALARCLMRRWPAITPARVVGHADIAPGRKTDPGSAFDWQRLRALLPCAVGPRRASGEQP